MPRSRDPAPSRPETPAGLRKMAARARRLALGTDDVTAARMTAFAEELEARAAALEQAEQTFTHGEAAAIQNSDPDIGEG